MRVIFKRYIEYVFIDKMVVYSNDLDFQHQEPSSHECNNPVKETWHNDTHYD